MMKFSGLFVLAVAFLCVSPSYADTVHLGVTGMPDSTGDIGLFQTVLGTGSVDTLGFTLAQDTQVTSLNLYLSSFFFQMHGVGTYSITLENTGGTVFWNFLGSVPGSLSPTAFTGLLPAGSYTLQLEGVTCDSILSTACPQIAGLNFFERPSYIQIGGTVNEDPTTFNGHLGWDLFGNTVTNSPVPEPGTAALVGSGMLAAFAGMRRRLLKT
jgi:hypothetical protein